MKLIHDFFEILQTSATQEGFISAIQLNPGHIIYSGHFPGHPVTPGVILMQIVHELLEKHFSRDCKLLTMHQCKFLKVLNPIETSRVIIHIGFKEADELLSVNARGENGTTIFFKLQSVYRFV